MKEKLDHDGDGAVDLDEMNSTGNLMPATMCDTDFSSLLGYLRAKTDDPAALQAAAILELNHNKEASAPSAANSRIFKGRPSRGGEEDSLGLQKCGEPLRATLAANS
ncbi:hypothetical protein ATY81_26695 [Rhizobium sp. R72]|nr:hypothetical protein ATY81_26695 [Rhizobium sp. R72]OWV98982.1 hypothetical protein ATY80_26695 [Rhizobium sp. R711]